MKDGLSIRFHDAGAHSSGAQIDRSAQVMLSVEEGYGAVLVFIHRIFECIQSSNGFVILFGLQ